MAKKRRVNIGSDPELQRMLDDIKRQRYSSGKDRKVLSDRRLTLAISRVPGLREKLINSEIKDD